MQNTLAQVVSPFITPALAWAGLVLVSVPVAIHLLSRWRRKLQPWGAMRFLLEAYRKQRRRMRLEQWLLLLLRCLIVTLLGLALARPLTIGLLGRLLSGFNKQERIVNLVIDDSLSERAKDGSEKIRFNRSIETAYQVVDALGPGDLVTLWRAGRPVTSVIEEPTADHASLRSAIDALRPGYSRPDIDTALNDIKQSAKDRQNLDLPSITYLLSDFSQSAAYINQTPDRNHTLVDDGNTFVVMHTAISTSNVQLSMVRPRRNIIWVGDSHDASVAVEIKAARFADALPETTMNLHTSLIDPQGRSVASITKQVHFTNGQSEVALGVGLPIGSSSLRLQQQGGTFLTIRAQLDADIDSLPEDNQAQAVIEIRRKMRVAVVDEPRNVLQSLDYGPTQGQWVSLALNPQIIGTSEAVEVVPLAPTQLNDSQIFESLDAIMLMRPDNVVRTGWGELKKFANAGGLVWVFTPSNDGASPWVTQMLETFEFDWHLGLEPVIEAEGSTGLTLSSRPLTAEPLGQLAADWQALIRPIRVWRYLALSVDEANAWIVLNQSPEEAGNVLLAHHQVGTGSLLLLSTAVDTRWTNLPTKPLFVPLVHEILQGVLGSRIQPSVVYGISGDLPELGPTWSGVTSLNRLQVSGDVISATASSDRPVQIPQLKTTMTGAALASPVELPGVYQASNDEGTKQLVVNPDSVAGDTRQIDEDSFKYWLDGLGNWQWLDENNPAAALQSTTGTTDIGRTLLWIVLGLVLIETVVSRRFSHADAEVQEFLGRQLWRSMIRMRSGKKQTRRSGRAA